MQRIFQGEDHGDLVERHVENLWKICGVFEGIISCNNRKVVEWIVDLSLWDGYLLLKEVHV